MCVCCNDYMYKYMLVWCEFTKLRAYSPTVFMVSGFSGGKAGLYTLAWLTSVYGFCFSLDENNIPLFSLIHLWNVNVWFINLMVMDYESNKNMFYKFFIFL